MAHVESAGEAPETPDHENARRVLAAIASAGGEATTSTLTDMLGLSASAVGHHAKENLATAGLVEHVGTVDEGYPHPTNKYALTARGETVAAACGPALSDDDLRVLVQQQAETIAGLQDTVDDLRATVAELETALDDTEAELDRHKDAINKNTERSAKALTLLRALHDDDELAQALDDGTDADAGGA